MLRRATLEDADALSALASTCFTQTFGHLYAPDDLDRFIHEAYSPEVLRAELADPKRPTWLLFEELSMDTDGRGTFLERSVVAQPRGRSSDSRGCDPCVVAQWDSTDLRWFCMQCDKDPGHEQNNGSPD